VLLLRILFIPELYALTPSLAIGGVLLGVGTGVDKIISWLRIAKNSERSIRNRAFLLILARPGCDIRNGTKDASIT